MSSSFIEFADGYVRDDLAARREPIQGGTFLRTGHVKPEIGHRAEIQISVGSHYCLLSGVVTRVGDLPTYDQWVTTSSFAPPPMACDCAAVDPYRSLAPDIIMVFNDYCPEPDCIMRAIREGKTRMTVEEVMNRSYEVLKLLHGQTLTSFCYLNFSYFDLEDVLPFDQGHIYKVELKADDNKICSWCVESIQDVTDWPVKDIPQAFKDWRIGRKSANAAPYDLNDEERKKWWTKRREAMETAEAEDSEDGESSEESHEDSEDVELSEESHEDHSSTSSSSGQKSTQLT